MKKIRIYFDSTLKKMKNIRPYQLKRFGIILLGVLVIVGFVYKKYVKNYEIESTVGAYRIENEEKNIVSIGISPIKVLNPLMTKDEDMRYITPLIYSSLFYQDENMTPKPDLVESFKVDKKKLTIKLKNAKWEDGTAIGADDVVFTFNLIKSIGKDGTYGAILNKIKSIKGDGNDVDVNFVDDEDINLAYLKFPIMPSHKYSGYSAFKKQLEDFEFVGSGKYKAGAFKKEKGMSLYPNENYYGTKPKSRVEVKIIKGNSINFVEDSNISALMIKDQERSGLFTKNNIKIHNIPSNQMEIVAFNTKNGITAKDKVRRAISFSIDSSNIIEEAYSNSAVLNSTPILSGYMNNTFKSEYKFDKSKAQELLKEEKLQYDSKDGKLKDEEDKTVSLSIVVDKDNASRLEAGEKIAKTLQDLGIEVNLQPINSAELKTRLSAGNFNLAIIGFGLDEYWDYKSLLLSTGANNFTGFENKELDEKVKELYSGKTLEENEKIVEEIKKIIENFAPYYCICYRTYGIVKAPVFLGELKVNFLSPYQSIETWTSNYEKRVIEDVNVDTSQLEKKTD